jgi:hypothetical protein
MAGERHRGLRWNDVERLVRLLLGIADEIVRLIKAVHGG